MRGGSLYKYFTKRKWADKFLQGEVLFRALSYYQDFEDEYVRGDRNEGTSVFRPKDGLSVNDLTQDAAFSLPGHAFRSSVKLDEIFVFCASRSFTSELRQRFEAVLCVEVCSIPGFCDRISSKLPNANFPGRPGRKRIGHRVEYYKDTEAPGSRWALPDRIATSKLDHFAWQDEFRLVFSFTDALHFENTSLAISAGKVSKPRRTRNHPEHTVQTGCLQDICRLHEFK